MNGTTEGDGRDGDKTLVARARARVDTHWTRFLYRDALWPSRLRQAREDIRAAPARRWTPVRWLLRQRRASPLRQGAALLGLYIVLHLATGGALRLAWWATSAIPDAGDLLLRVHPARFPLL